MINRLSILLLLPMFLLGQYRDIPDVVTKVATSAGGFLKLETSARAIGMGGSFVASGRGCLLYTSPSPRDLSTSRMPSSA